MSINGYRYRLRYRSTFGLPHDLVFFSKSKSTAKRICFVLRCKGMGKKNPSPENI